MLFEMLRLLVMLPVLIACADGAAERFTQDVVPLLERRCATSACHGVAPDDEWPTTDGYFVRLDRRGRIASSREARATSLQRVSVRAPMTSSLLRVPAPLWLSGGPHAGGVLFSGDDDPARQTLLDWIRLEERGGEDLDLTPLEEQFGRDVAPVLAERCARDGCHGPTDVAFAAFPMHTVESELSDVDIRAARAMVRKFLNLWGSHVTQSRLIRKALGAHSGGIAHRGDRATFFPEAPLDAPLEAPGLQAMLRWADAERAAVEVDTQQPVGILYVDGAPAPRAPYRIETGLTGSDLFLAGWPEPGTPRNLTAALHPDGPAEIRDVALSHDANRVAFAMRRADQREFAMWELNLDDGNARAVTDGPGSFVQPAYASDGRILAVWDGHGELASDGTGVAPELVAITPGRTFERLTYTPGPEMAPAMLSSGKTRGEVIFATRRQGELSRQGVLFRFPLCHDARLHGEPEYHVQFGASMAPLALHIARDLPDGRQVMTVLASPDEPDDRGMLAILDRALGPDLADVGETSLAGYQPPIAWLDHSPRYRDPAVLPDGRVLVSMDAEDTLGEDAIWIVTITDGEEGSSLGDLQPWLARPGRSLRSALPVFRRPAEDDHHAETVDPSLSEGFMVLRDVAVLEALFDRTAPRGVRELRTDIAGVRVLASMGALARDVAHVPGGGTTVGLSGQIPARIIAEIELPADRSAWLRVPARTPLMLSYIDARGMEVGRHLDRWFYAEGGETVPGGTNAPTYAHACAGCHGSLSGDPDDSSAPPPDAISSASVTLSTHRDRDPRQPLEPTAMTGGEVVDFATSVQPLLARCTGCHGGDVPDGDLSLESGPGVRFDAAYETLATFIDLDTLRARRSPLIERLLGEDLDAAGSPTGVCPPDGPDSALVQTFTRWIEAGAFHDLAVVE